jgi:membrane protease YdiL (CAAX protease family)
LQKSRHAIDPIELETKSPHTSNISGRTAGSKMEENLVKESATRQRFAEKDGIRSKLLEIGVVLFIFATPSLASWGCFLIWGEEYQRFEKDLHNEQYRSSLAYHVASFDDIFLSLRYVPVVLFLMWRSSDGWDHFGIVKPKMHKDILIGFGLAFAIIFIRGFFYSIFDNRPGWAFHWNRFYPGPVPLNLAVLLLGKACAVGFSEELVGRSYLIPRLEEVMGSSWRAVILSSIFFGLLHSYKSPMGICLSMASGCVWGITFCKTRRIWPVALSHAIIDYISFTRVLVGF